MPDGQKPTVPRKTTAQLIADEEKKSGQLKARLEELKTRQRAEERKKENHRKIIVGAAVLAHIKINPVFRKQVQEALNLAVTDPKHREAIRDVLNEKAFMTAVKEAMRLAKAAAKELAAAQSADQGKAGPEKDEPPPA
jgi:exonuclease III